MKQILLLIMLCSITGLTFAQEEGSEYLFEEFQQAVVIYKDGRQFQVELNYNLIDGRFLFIDKQDNDLLKEFAEPDKVSAIRVDKRTFLLNKRGAVEVLQFNPSLVVQYKGKIREKDKKVAYGGRSATSAVQSYSGIHSGGVWHPFEGERQTLAGIQKIYQIEKNGKKNSFTTEKQFLKIYSKNKDQLEKFIQENNLDFNEIAHVIYLYNYAEENYS